MQTLTLNLASTIVDHALEKMNAIGCQPLTVAVLDTGGHLLVLKRADGSGILRPDIAIAKAWGVLGMGLGGRQLAQRAEAAPAFFAALSSISGGRIAPVQGGVLVRNDEGTLVGSVGISGDRSDVDETCAIYAIERAGLFADAG
jgi:uncharacterized protein GlcG (DUF336 family)